MAPCVMCLVAFGMRTVEDTTFGNMGPLELHWNLGTQRTSFRLLAELLPSGSFQQVGPKQMCSTSRSPLLSTDTVVLPLRSPRLELRSIAHF